MDNLLLALFFTLSIIQAYFVYMCYKVSKKTGIIPWNSFAFLITALASSLMMTGLKLYKVIEQNGQCTTVCENIRVAYLTFLLLSDSIFGLNQWFFSMELKQKLTDSQAWIDNYCFKYTTLLTLAFFIFLQMAFGFYYKSTINEMMCAIITGVLTVILVDAMIRIRVCLGEFDRNFSVVLTQVVAFLL